MFNLNTNSDDSHQLMGAIDWNTTPLGPPATWSSRILGQVEMILLSRQPMYIALGPDLRFIYNDAYRTIIGARHPSAFGTPMREVFADIWAELDQLFDDVLHGTPQVVENTKISTPWREGRPFGWFSFGLVPVYDDSGKIAGFTASIFETTKYQEAKQLLLESEERQAYLLSLSDALRDLGSADEIRVAAAEVLGRHLGACQVAYAEHDDDAHFIITKNYVDGVSDASGRYSYANFGTDLLVDLQAGRPRIVPDVRADDRLDQAGKLALLHHGIQASLNIPLVKSGKLVAFIGVNYPAPHDFKEEEIEHVRETAERTWAAVERARGEAILREEEEWLGAQNEAFQLAMDGAPIGKTLELLGQSAVSRIAGARYAFYVRYPNADELKHVVGMSDDYAASVDRFKISEDSLSCGLAVATGSPIITSDVHQEPRWKPWLWMADAHSFRGCWSYPIRTSRGKVVGSFALYFSDPRHATQRERDIAGRVTYAAAIIISRSQEAEERARAEDALRLSEERFQQFAKASASGLWIRDAETLTMEFMSPALSTIYGVDSSELLGEEKQWASMIIPEDRDSAVNHLLQARQGASAVHEFRIQRVSDQAFRWIRNTDFPLRDNGDIPRVGGIAEDVTEAKLSAEHQGVLLAELQHRVRNLMGMIRVMANRSASGPSSVEEYRSSLEGRLLALARVQTLLTRQANLGGSLRNIVETEIAAQAHHPSQYTLSGPDVMLSPKAVEVLTLAFHELSTNALKYGALSIPEGTVTVRWVVEEERGKPWLSLDWIESGAPFREPPSRRGFGSELIEMKIPYELRGTGKIMFDGGQASCQLRIPLRIAESILATDAPTPVKIHGGSLDMTDAPDLSGRSILIVEDDYYMASDFASVLRSAGAEVLGPCPSEEAALSVLEHTTPTGALLDLNLGGGGPRFEIARILEGRGIPFMFITGYDPDVIPTEMETIARLQKPVPLRAIVEALALL
ncbi:PAS domain S-box-containing protein [Neorhizobium huautlense]|uniref:Blue-light-activated histidine kinase n=1 Tax=Neorhizobium huautlense TaxID=67774 RepID=A0ABT9Q2U1_9HYPH|nr:GAF domain-containing protein [Neorhizobium huautlense]MDP9840409.1 PAS domain S-box-containing protein [Neorhizobium huautlense]